jgi:hypothetical protein
MREGLVVLRMVRVGDYLKNKEQGGDIYRGEIVDSMHVYPISPSSKYILKKLFQIDL